MKDENGDSDGAGNFFITSNTVGTTITSLDGVTREARKDICIELCDDNTTVNLSVPALKWKGYSGGGNGIQESLECIFTPSLID